MPILDIGKNIKNWISGTDLFVRGGMNVFFCLRARELSAEIPRERKSIYKVTFLKLWNWRHYDITIFLSLKLSYLLSLQNTLIVMSICSCVYHPLMGWLTSLLMFVVSFRNVFIANLAVSDLCLCLVTMPLTLVEVHHQRHDYLSPCHLFSTLAL